MNSLEALATVHAGTGVFRTIPSDLPAETYLAPRPQPVDLNLALADGAFRWSANMAAAPCKTASAVSATPRNSAVGIHGLNLNEVLLGALDRNTSSLRRRDCPQMWHHPSKGDARHLLQTDLRPRLSEITDLDRGTLNVLQAQTGALKQWPITEMLYADRMRGAYPAARNFRNGIQSDH